MSAPPETPALAPGVELVTIEVNGRRLQARKGQMIIQAADAAGIYIPRFCYHPKLSIAANCRMCLVEVEKSPKPLPACATPVAEGMKVWTQSDRARDAQNGTMEFLLINHPLDCPICDRGGECPLQDQSLGYGKDASRYREAKRVVVDVDIGPLVATFMTRCIHCTRCVRFGEELAGIMEFGALGRGEHMEIRTFLARSVDSEISGNVIDVCPVGALTSKPFQFRARAWELEHHAGVSPHDCVGANLNVQTLGGRVLRVLPRDNEEVNECWLSDRDRFSYEAVNSEERLTVPMIRRAGHWEETDWATALAFTVTGLRGALSAHGAAQIGALAAPTATLEEFYLLQKLMRGLGSGNVDHRLRQLDFRDDPVAPPFPWLGRPIAALEDLDACLLVGSNPRKDQPLLNLRLRQAVRRGARILAVNPLDYDFNHPLTAKVVAGPDGMVQALAGIARAAALKGMPLPPSFVQQFAPRVPTDAERRIAEELARGRRAAVLLGPFAAGHPQAAVLRALAELVAELSGAGLGHLPEANAAGAWFAGCVPHRGPAGAGALAGRNAVDMLRQPLKAYLVFGAEPELDCLDGDGAARAMAAAEFVVMASVFKPTADRSRALDYASVLLPLAPFTETAGTFINAEGRVQRFEAAAGPRGDARPGWKILRVLGNGLALDGFAQESIADVRAEIPPAGVAPSARLAPWSLPAPVQPAALPEGSLMRLAEVPIYAVDALTRRASALQQTADNPSPAARLNASQAAALGLAGAARVAVGMASGEARLDLVIDHRVPDGCVLVPSGYPETAVLGAHGPATVTRADA